MRGGVKSPSFYLTFKKLKPTKNGKFRIHNGGN